MLFSNARRDGFEEKLCVQEESFRGGSDFEVILSWIKARKVRFPYMASRGKEMSNLKSIIATRRGRIPFSFLSYSGNLFRYATVSVKDRCTSGEKCRISVADLLWCVNK